MLKKYKPMPSFMTKQLNYVNIGIIDTPIGISIIQIP